MIENVNISEEAPSADELLDGALAALRRIAALTERVRRLIDQNEALKLAVAAAQRTNVPAPASGTDHEVAERIASKCVADVGHAANTMWYGLHYFVDGEPLADAIARALRDARIAQCRRDATMILREAETWWNTFMRPHFPTYIANRLLARAVEMEKAP